MSPPFVYPRIPVIGHWVGFIRHQLRYFVKVWADNGIPPIFGVNIFGIRYYIVCSPDFASAVQRNARTLSFRAFAVQFASKMCLLSPEADAIIKQDLQNDAAQVGFTNVFTTIQNSHLNMGKDHDSLVDVVIRQVSLLVNSASLRGHHTSSLVQYTRHNMLHVGMTALYGTTHPLSDHAMVKAWFDLDATFGDLVLKPLPQYFAATAFNNRQKIFDATAKYVAEKGWNNQGSECMKARMRTYAEYGISDENISRLEIAFMVGLTANTSNASFWVLSTLFSQLELLARVRTEIEAVTRVSDDGPSRQISLDVTHLKERCPLLVSLLLEVLRHYSAGASVRLVQEDTVVNGYLLKKDGVVFIPAPNFHSNTALFGQNATTLDPYRFVQEPGETAFKDTGRVPQGAFRVFGGGVTLCPGRHLAATEILLFVALTAMRFDIQPHSGVWIQLKRDFSNMSTTIPAPLGDITVDMIPRAAWNDGTWELRASPLTKGFDLVIYPSKQA